MFLQSWVRNYVKKVLQIQVEIGVFSPGRLKDQKVLLFGFSERLADGLLNCILQKSQRYENNQKSKKKGENLAKKLGENKVTLPVVLCSTVDLQKCSSRRQISKRKTFCILLPDKTEGDIWDPYRNQSCSGTRHWWRTIWQVSYLYIPLPVLSFPKDVRVQISPLYVNSVLVIILIILPAYE